VVEESIMRSMTKETSPDRVVSSGLNWSEPLEEQIKGYRAFQISGRLRRGHSDGNPYSDSWLCSQSFYYELSIQNTYEVTPVFAKKKTSVSRTDTAAIPYSGD
jgi:hypothetical protein